MTTKTYKNRWSRVTATSCHVTSNRVSSLPDKIPLENVSLETSFSLVVAAEPGLLSMSPAGMTNSREGVSGPTLLFFALFSPSVSSPLSSSCSDLLQQVQFRKGMRTFLTKTSMGRDMGTDCGRWCRASTQMVSRAASTPRHSTITKYTSET